MLVGPEHVHRAVVAVMRGGRPRAAWYAGWTSGSARRSARPKTWLTQSITGCRRAEVGAEQRGVGADLLGGAEVLGDVGAPEPVDRLLRVADDEQAARQRARAVASRCRAPGHRGGREPHRDLELDRIGVLELVEQDPLVARVQQRRGRRGGWRAAAGRARAGRGTRACRRHARASAAVEHERPDDRAAADRWRYVPRPRRISSSPIAADVALPRRAASASAAAPPCSFQLVLLPPLGALRQRSAIAATVVEAGADRVARGVEQPDDSSRDLRRALRPAGRRRVRSCVHSCSTASANSARCRARTVAVASRSTRSSTRSQLAWKSSATRRTPRWTPKPSNSHSCTNSLPPSIAPAGGSGSSSSRSSRSSHRSSEREVALELVEHA